MDDYQFGYITKLENIKKKLLRQFMSLFIYKQRKLYLPTCKGGGKKREKLNSKEFNFAY